MTKEEQWIKESIENYIFAYTGKRAKISDADAQHFTASVISYHNLCTPRVAEALKKEPAVAINTWQDLQSVYVVTKRHLLDYDNGPIEQFPSSTEELFTEILNAIKGGERYE